VDVHANRGQGFLTFEVPEPNYAAEEWQDMIHWERSQVLEPPILKEMSDDQIQGFLEEPFQLDVPSNTQFVERLIQTVTRIGTKAATAERRDGLMRATLSHRAKLPKCETKKDFLSN
jgi:hypothetical protein